MDTYYDKQLNKLKVGGELYDDIISQPENGRQAYIFCRYCVLHAIVNFLNYTLDETKTSIEDFMDDNDEDIDSLINACKTDGNMKITDLTDCENYKEKIKDEIDLLYSMFCPPENIGKTESEMTSHITKQYYEQFPPSLKNFPLLPEKQIIYIIDFEAFCIENSQSLLTSMESETDPFVREALICHKANHFQQKIEKFTYIQKNLMSINENKNYKCLRRLLSSDYYLFPQISLFSIIEKRLFNRKANHIGELTRTIDFGIFDKDCNVKLLIEINDKSHDEESRRLRDLNVQTILQKADIKLIILNSFDYENEKLLLQKLGDFAKKHS
ncbi:MAG: DUF2726 domain-containing protein [Bacilli bacterium]|nr:DUF2726 domain-containing protein [Bacilli bacterium]